MSFVTMIEHVFVPVLVPLGFDRSDPSLSGRAYIARFSSRSHSVTISYEPGDDYFFVRVSSSPRPTLAELDDPTVTTSLNEINGRYMPTISAEERARGASLLEIPTDDPIDRRMLKAALELALVLPKHLEDTLDAATDLSG
jgi:hypothetical protein